MSSKKLRRIESGKRPRHRSGKEADPVLSKPNFFVRGPGSISFMTNIFKIVGNRRAIYEYECLERNLYPRIRGAFYDYDFPLVDAKDVLSLVIGSSPGRSMQWQGPACFPTDGIYPPGYDYRGLFLVQERELLRRLMQVIFSMKESVAQNSAVTSLKLDIINIEQDARSAFRRAELVYTASAPDDYMRVTVQGEMNEPNTFTFEPSDTWLTNRYCKVEPGALLFYAERA